MSPEMEFLSSRKVLEPFRIPAVCGAQTGLPVTIRNRTRPSATLQARLLASAEAARRKAAALPLGAAKNTLLRKAELVERTAATAKWVATPRSPLPE